MDGEKMSCAKRILRHVGMGIAAAVGIGVLALLLGFLVQFLWNTMLPDLFKFPYITYWQAFGLIILAHLLFGHFTKGHGCHHKKHWKKFHGCHSAEVGEEESCCTGDYKKWKYYKDFWKEEGKEAFEKYLEKKKNSSL